MTDPTEPAPATTAGEQDHTDPDVFRGEDVDAPDDAGTPPLQDD
jgi:hypothetical protein